MVTILLNKISKLNLFDAVKKLKNITTTPNLKFCEPIAAKYLRSESVRISVEKRFEEFYTPTSETNCSHCSFVLPKIKKSG